MERIFFLISQQNKDHDPQANMFYTMKKKPHCKTKGELLKDNHIFPIDSSFRLVFTLYINSSKFFWFFCRQNFLLFSFHVKRKHFVEYKGSDLCLFCHLCQQKRLSSIQRTSKGCHEIPTHCTLCPHFKFTLELLCWFFCLVHFSTKSFVSSYNMWRFLYDSKQEVKTSLLLMENNYLLPPALKHD